VTGRAPRADRRRARTRDDQLRRRAACRGSRYYAPADALGALLPRVLPSGRPSGSSRRIAAGGSSPTAASSSTCTSIAC
jgi:hypothetical protein